jgi:glycosyltransferase involved in cell wall biosynthesis
MAAARKVPSNRWEADPDVLLATLGAPRVSVIIPHFNTPELLVKCLQAVAAQQLDYGWFEIIVVDNGSRLPMRLLEATWPGVRFLVERQPGPGPARNTGVKASHADILAFVDADVRVAPGWLKAAVRAVGKRPLALVGGDVRIDVGDRKRMTEVEAFESVFSFRQKNYIRKKHYSVTANLVMTRAVFDRAGPFDGIDKPEDIAFGERAFALGMRTRYDGRMLAFHPARKDFDDMRRKFARQAHQGFTHHLGRGRPLLEWDVRAAAVAASGLAHMPMMLFSRRVTGLGNRYRGLRFLLRMRWARALDMFALSAKARSGDQLALVNWNS